jgi:predicted phage-related endonuclease
VREPKVGEHWVYKCDVAKQHWIEEVIEQECPDQWLVRIVKSFTHPDLLGEKHTLYKANIETGLSYPCPFYNTPLYKAINGL